MNSVSLATDELIQLSNWARQCVPIVCFANGTLTVTEGRDQKTVIELTKNRVKYSHDRLGHRSYAIDNWIPWNTEENIELLQFYSNPTMGYRLLSRPSEDFPTDTAILFTESAKGDLTFSYPITFKPAIDAVIQEAQKAFSVK